MSIDITGVGAIADLAGTVINKIWPDKSEQERAQIAQAVAIVQGQLDINKAEAASSSAFTSGWRPSVGWVCSLALLYNFVAKPIIAFAFVAAGHPLPPLPGIDDTLWQLLFGMLGLGGLRTVEKIKGVAS
jgi:hypothetical protein